MQNTFGPHLQNLMKKECRKTPPLPCPIVLRGIAEQYKGDTEETIVAEERD